MPNLRLLDSAAIYYFRIDYRVISASPTSLLYPINRVKGYSREAFITDLINEEKIDSHGALDDLTILCKPQSFGGCQASLSLVIMHQRVWARLISRYPSEVYDCRCTS
jgi:hypothetical protein